MNINKEELYRELKRKIVRGVHPKSIYIFGSFARDEETENSDIDILIEKDTELEIQKRYGMVRKFLKGLAFPCDILVYTPQEIKEKVKDKYSVVFQAINKGIKLL